MGGKVIKKREFFMLGPVPKKRGAPLKQNITQIDDGWEKGKEAVIL